MTIISLSLQTATNKLKFTSLAADEFDLWNCLTDNTSGDSYYDVAPNHPELSKIVSITICGIEKNGNFKFATFSDMDESILLSKFIDVISKFTPNNKVVCYDAHHVSTTIIKRSIINGVECPKLNIFGVTSLWPSRQKIPLALMANLVSVPSNGCVTDNKEINSTYWIDRNSDWIDRNSELMSMVVYLLHEKLTRIAW